tara:strand:- start:6841 stop:7476 length:636 start_codon:yes stop_codon:yes gene_type:complete
MFNSLGRAHVESTIGGARGHVLRRITHLSMIILPFIYYWHGNQIAELVTEIIEIETSREGVVLIALSLLVIIEAIRLFFGIAILGQRTYEKRQISALAWGGISVCICFLFAPLGGYKDAYIGLPIIFTISIVDPLLGEARRIFESDKLVILLAFIVGFLIWILSSLLLQTPMWLSLIMPPLAIASEWPSLKYIDDNATMILIPLIFSLLLI